MPTDHSTQRYKLSSTLAGHAADVRALAGCPRPAHLADSSASDASAGYSAQQPFLFSSSRDGTARAWICQGSEAGTAGGGGGGGGWVEGPVFGGGGAGHDGFVNAVEWLQPSSEAEGGESLHSRRLTGGNSASSGAAGVPLLRWPSRPGAPVCSPATCTDALPTATTRPPPDRRTRQTHPRLAAPGPF